MKEDLLLGVMLKLKIIQILKKKKKVLEDYGYELSSDEEDRKSHRKDDRKQGRNEFHQNKGDYHEKRSYSKNEYDKREPREQRTFEQAPFDISRVSKDGPFVVYMGNLPFDVSQQDVANFFTVDIPDEEIVDINLIKDRDTQKFKGIAYVTFESLQGLKTAYSFHGKKIKERSIKVDIAEQKKEKRDFKKFDKFEKREPREPREPREVRDSVADKVDNWRMKPKDYTAPKKKEFEEKKDFQKKDYPKKEFTKKNTQKKKENIKKERNLF